MDARVPAPPAPRWPFLRRLRALLIVVARLSLSLPAATISAIRHRQARPRAAIQGPAAAVLRVSRSEPSLAALACDDVPPAAAPQRAAGGEGLESTASAPLGCDSGSASGGPGGGDERGAASDLVEARGTTCRVTRRLTVSRDSEGRKVINEYVRERVIGRGSYAKVVLYRHASTGLMCALKVCCKSRLKRVRVAPGETALMDVQREVRVLQRLQHPHVVQLREVIDDPLADKLYLVFEYVEGRPLFPDDAPPAGGVGEDTARRVFQDVSAALLYVHSQGVVHNDVKPANILCSSQGGAKLSDFGVCQEVTPPNDWQRRSPGTPAFTAPECCTGAPFRGMAADTWALGCTLFAMTSGRHPFLGTSLMDTYDKIQSEPLILPAGISPSLADLLTRLLHKDPLQRISLAQAAAHPWVLHAALPSSPPSPAP
ncbi:hypothetical protein CLOM_g7485 [Closterium sp. NIES-68]|nr:hypothetical protein CLOM_g7485 [Closterium sp. NIES-68]GJP87004.1 hypothetical protein CLOP_g16976 [Closterium sp. NIES-67]